VLKQELKYDSSSWCGYTHTAVDLFWGHNSLRDSLNIALCPVWCNDRQHSRDKATTLKAQFSL